jgi:hypothetical protein
MDAFHASSKTALRVTIAKPYRKLDLRANKNGELLFLAEQHGFDAFLTIDRGLEHQRISATVELQS